MATEEDNFDIDIYGEEGGNEDYHEEGNREHNNAEIPISHEHDTDTSFAQSNDDHKNHEMVNSTDSHTTSVPNKPPLQSLKRKEGPDDRPVDPNATSALVLSELHWWITDDDIRGWTKEADCEDEVRDLTFHEQKINGKSKGQAFVLLDSPQGATALKHVVDSHNETMKYKTKFHVAFSPSTANPFKTLPKDNAMRNSGSARGGNASGYGGSPTHSGMSGGGYRGGRGGHNRGNYSSNGFSGRGGYQGGMQSGYQGNPMNNYSQMGGMSPGYGGGYNNRGGMMGGMRGGNMAMRGGRGGMNGAGMMGMPMAGAMGMPMPGMGMGMQAMNPAMAMPGVGGFHGAPYNNGFFPQQGGDASWNPHGAKRTRQE